MREGEGGKGRGGDKRYAMREQSTNAHAGGRAGKAGKAEVCWKEGKTSVSSRQEEGWLGKKSVASKQAGRGLARQEVGG